MQNLALDFVQAPSLQPTLAPPRGYVVEVGGEVVSEYGTLTAALSAGLEAKNRDRQAKVRVYDASERTMG